MAPAAWAKLLDRKFFGLPLFVLARHVISPFTAVALKPDEISHCLMHLADSFSIRLPPSASLVLRLAKASTARAEPRLIGSATLRMISIHA